MTICSRSKTRLGDNFSVWSPQTMSSCRPPQCVLAYVRPWKDFSQDNCGLCFALWKTPQHARTLVQTQTTKLVGHGATFGTISVPRCVITVIKKWLVEFCCHPAVMYAYGKRKAWTGSASPLAESCTNTACAPADLHQPHTSFVQHGI